MIYLGGDNWPAEYRDAIFMNNINGARLNIDELKKSGSGYVGVHHDDFMAMNDSWSQWLNFKYDASGSVFAIDWYDKNQCHSPNPDVHDKSLGRIFKISHEKDVFVTENLFEATDLELANYQTHANEWYARQSRIILQERGGNRKSQKALKGILANDPEVTHQLRALWTLHAMEALDEKEMHALLADPNEYIRSWAVQLLAESKSVSTETLAKFTEMAKADSSPMVRLYLVSAMLRLQPDLRWDVLTALSQRAEDAEDHNLPLMLWYALEPLTDLDAKRALTLAEDAKIPILLEYTMQKLGEKNVMAPQESSPVHH